MQIPDSPTQVRRNRRVATVSDEMDGMDEMDEMQVQAQVDRVDDKGKQRDSCCDVERGKQDITNIIRNFKTDIDRVISQSLHMEPEEVWGFSSTERQPTPTIPLSPSNSESPAATNQSQPLEPEPARSAEAPSDARPVVHTNVLCDICKEVIVGVRHKCLDCPGLASQPPVLRSRIY